MAVPTKGTTGKDIVTGVASGELDALSNDVDKINSAAFKLGGFLKLFKSSISDIDNTIVSLDQKFAKVMQTMGVGQRYSAMIKENFAKASPEVISMGGTLDDIVTVQQDLATNSNKNILATKEVIEGMVATQKVTGIQSSTLLQNFMDAGYEAEQITDQMYNVHKIAQNMGVNARAVSSMVVSNLDKLNKFTFDGGVDGLAKMAAKAAMFRIDMNETFSLAERLLSPENAIETANALQRLGGSASQLADPLRLMDLAQNNVPELQNQLTKLVEKYTYFDEKTKTFQIMPGARREIKEIGNALNISEKSIVNMGVEGAKLKKKLSEINFSGLDFTKEQQEQIANLSKLNKDNKYEIEFKDESGKTITKTLDQLKGSEGEIKRFLENQSAEKGLSNEEKMIDLAKEQLGKADQIIAKIDAFKNALPMSVAGSQAGELYLDKALTSVTLKTQKTIDDVNLNNKTLSDALNNSAGKLDKLIEGIAEGDFSKVINGLKGLGGEIRGVISESLIKPQLETLTQIADALPGLGTALKEIGITEENLTNAIDKFTGVLDGATKSEDFIWRPGEGISKFAENDLVIAGTGLMSKSQPMPVNETITNNTNTAVTSETKVGGEVTFKVSLDTNGNLGNLGMNEATVLGNRIADAIKNSPDLQNKIKAALEFSKQA
jgi:hypothetical protein